MTEKPSISQKIGSNFAVLQTYVDNVFEFGFKKLKTFGKESQPIENPETLKEQATELVHKSAGFIGDVGSSYYDTYQKLKAEKEEKNSEK